MTLKALCGLGPGSSAILQHVSCTLGFVWSITLTGSCPYHMPLLDYCHQPYSSFRLHPSNHLFSKQDPQSPHAAHMAVETWHLFVWLSVIPQTINSMRVKETCTTFVQCCIFQHYGQGGHRVGIRNKRRHESMESHTWWLYSRWILETRHIL